MKFEEEITLYFEENFKNIKLFELQVRLLGESFSNLLRKCVEIV